MDQHEVLAQRMRQLLSPDPPAPAFRKRVRRFSDADRRPDGDGPGRQAATAVLSNDGSRWLPAPNEQSQRTSPGRSSVTHGEPTDDIPQHQLQQHSCSAARCAVSRVFETTELLEILLGHLDTPDVLSLRRTNSHWHTTVEKSPTLRLHFFTYGQWSRPGADFQLLPLSIPGLTIERDREIYHGQWIKITFTSEAARRICPNPTPHTRVRSRSIYEGLRGGLGSGSRSSNWPTSSTSMTPQTEGISAINYENLHVTQPPTVGMQAFILDESAAGVTDGELPVDERNAEDSQSQPTACAKLNCESGITLGFLAEQAQALLASQKEESGPSTAGSTELRVVFKAIMSFCKPQHTPRRRDRGRVVTRL